jgi:hypothetical protein
MQTEQVEELQANLSLYLPQGMSRLNAFHNNQCKMTQAQAK